MVTNAQQISASLEAIARIESGEGRAPLMGRKEALALHGERLSAAHAYLPSGSGFDNGTEIDERSTPSRLVLLTSFHHMDENGNYDGWTSHTVTVTPTFAGLDVRVSGRDRNNIKDYIADVFRAALEEAAH